MRDNQTALYSRQEIEALYKPIKTPVTLKLDADVLAWFKEGGRGYQTRINEELRRIMREAQTQ